MTIQMLDHVATPQDLRKVVDIETRRVAFVMPMTLDHILEGPEEIRDTARATLFGDRLPYATIADINFEVVGFTPTFGDEPARVHIKVTGRLDEIVCAEISSNNNRTLRDLLGHEDILCDLSPDLLDKFPLDSPVGKRIADLYRAVVACDLEGDVVNFHGAMEILVGAIEKNA